MPLAVGVQSYVSAFTSNRFLLYSVLSVGAVATAIANALRMHSNFYALTIHLAQSNASVIVLANFLVLIAILLGRAWQHVFFGELRAMEVERLYDRVWFFITESLLAFTIFRDDFDVPFALMFGLLLFTKCFHWLLSDRIEWMDQRPYPGPPLLFHIRTNALICILWLTDVITYVLILDNLLTNGFSGTILFASEYSILTANLINSASKYAISIYDLRRASNHGGENAPPWEDKSMWIFYVELITDFMKLVTYLVFFMVVFAFYGIPLHIIRDVYITGRSFYTRFRDLVRYRTATRNMDERYPSATSEELSAMSDRTCIICREEMMSPDLAPANQDQSNASDPPTTTPNIARSEGPNTTPKRLPCGHVFHFHCLRSWLERQQSCPTCRRSVLEDNQLANSTARAPAQPQPGAIPQMQNGGQQNQRNGGGLFGRIIEMARMQPIVPGQFANGMVPPALQQHQQQPPLLNQQHLNIPQQAGPGAPAAQGQGWEVVMPAIDQPPEQFGGFLGPDGEWQVWPSDPHPPQQPAVNGVADQTQGQAGAATHVATAASTQQQPPPASTTENHAIATSPVTPAGASSLQAGESAGVASNLSARRAAALAAMRRSQSNSSLVSQSSAATQNNASSETTTTVDKVDLNNKESIASTSSTSLFGDQKTTAGRQPTSANVPRFIPLYDTTLPTIRTTPSSFLSDPQRDLAARRAHIRGRMLDYMANHPSSSSRIGASSSNVQNVFRSGELPERLSDAQLAALDTLTRNAIDERLRVLESVSARASLCVEDLLRVRSVLPPLTNTRENRDGQVSSGDSTVASNTQVNAQGAGGEDSNPAAATAAEARPEVQAEHPILQ